MITPEVIHFVKQRMNLDDDERLLEDNETREVRNFRFGIGTGGKDGAGQNILSTVKVDNPGIAGTPKKVIGWCPDLETNSIIYAVFGEGGYHSFYKYSFDSGGTIKIFGSNVLNFQESSRITHMFVLDGILYWTDGYFSQFGANSDFEDGYNPPRKLNLEKAINYTNGWGGNFNNQYFYSVPKTSGRVFDILDYINKPPWKQPGLLDDVSITINSNNVDFDNGFGSDISLKGNNLTGKYFQFKYRWVYDDNSKSIWSAVSKIANPYQVEGISGILRGEVYENNVIGLILNTGREEVKRIEITLRDGNYGVWKIIDAIDKYDEDGAVLEYKGTDLLPEIDFNYLFYNNKAFIGADQIEVIRPFDYVPQVAGALTLIQDNRAVFGDYYEGYDPVDIDVDFEAEYQLRDYSTSEAVQAVSKLKLLSGEWYYKITYIDVVITGKIYTIRMMDDNYKIFTVSHVVQEGDDPILDVRNGLIDQLNKFCVAMGIESLPGSPEPPDRNIYISVDEVRPGSGAAPNWREPYAISYIGVNSENTWKSGALFEFGIVYSDRANRSGYVNAKNSEISLPSFGAFIEGGIVTPGTLAIHKSIIKWDINHQPPWWATHYHWVFTQKSYSYFIQHNVPAEDIDDDTSSDFTFITFNKQIEAMLDAAPGSNIEPYEWEKGDRLRLVGCKYHGETQQYYPQKLIDVEIDNIVYDTTAPYYGYKKDDAGIFELNKDGNKVRDPYKMKLTIPHVSREEMGLGNIPPEPAANRVIIEIYRPKKDPIGDNEIYYEFGECYTIINPHTSTRYHAMGVDDGSGYKQDQSAADPARGMFLRGNAYIKKRFFPSYPFGCEASTISDYYDSRFNDEGRVQIVNKDGERKRLKAGLRFTGKYIENTNVNEITSVDFDDAEFLPERFGAVGVLRERGHTLKVRQDSRLTSIYIGRAGLKQAAEEGVDVVVTTDRVLGTKFVGAARWGCSNPESECTDGKTSYFVDIDNNSIIRDALNGTFAISDYGIKDRVFKKCKYLKTLSESYILGAYDAKNDEVIFTFLGYERGSWNSETIVFNEAENGWKYFVDYVNADGDVVDTHAYINDNLVSFVNGYLYLHEAGATRNEFFGDQKISLVEVVSNLFPVEKKVFGTISVNANKAWNIPEIKITRGAPYTGRVVNEMESLLKAENFVEKEGLYCAAFKRNMTTTSLIPTIKDLFRGDKLRGQSAKITLTDDSTDLAVLFSIQIGITKSLL